MISMSQAGEVIHPRRIAQWWKHIVSKALSLFSILLIISTVLFPIASASAASGDNGSFVRYFPETGHNLIGQANAFYVRHGGEAIFGRPISEVVTDGAERVQYFERARFELRAAGIELTLIGRAVSAERTDPAFAQRAGSPARNRSYFPQTGHTLGGAFAWFWRSRGGLAIFGYPISEELVEEGVLVQYAASDNQPAAAAHGTHRLREWPDPAVLEGRAELTLTAPPDASVLFDRQRWPRPVYAGRHTIQAVMPDGRHSWADIELQAGQALTLTLPAGLMEPRQRSLPAAAPGTHIEQVWWADDAWRVMSVQDPPPAPQNQNRGSSEPTPTPQPGQTVAVTRSNVERLATLDAYAGLADQVHVDGQLREAVYRSNPSRGFSDQSFGTIEVRGWEQTVQTIAISTSLSLLRFAPNGAALIMAEQVPSGGEQVYLLRPNQARAPLVAVPGHIVRLSWRPDSAAVVIHSIQDERLTLTLVRLTPSVIAAVVADLPAADYSSGMVPLTWDDAGLLWVAADQEDTASSLWAAPLASLIPERRGPLDARALTRLADGSLRVVTIQDEHVVIGRYVNDIFIGETIVSRVPAAPDLVGIWQGTELLLQSDQRVWLLDVAEH